MCTFCALTVFIKPRDDTCFPIHNDVTGTLEIGHLAFVLELTLVTLNIPNHNILLPTVASAIIFRSFGSNKIGFSLNLT